jgi:hypothetical protein
MAMRHRRRWNVNEELKLQREYELLQMTIQEISKSHQRTEDAILCKLQKEGYIKRWSEANGYTQYLRSLPEYENLSYYLVYNDKLDDYDDDDDEVENEVEKDDEIEEEEDDEIDEEDDEIEEYEIPDVNESNNTSFWSEVRNMLSSLLYKKDASSSCVNSSTA